MTPVPDFIMFLGRFHVLLLHLPIGFILLLGIMEVLGRFARFKNTRPSIGLILALAVPATVFSALAGYLLSLSTSYEPGLLQLHLWMGLGTALGVCAAAGLYWKGKVHFYRPSLAMTVVLLILTSHYGGSLTHGRDHLTHYAPGPLRRWLGGSPQITANKVNTSYLNAEAYGMIAKPLLDKYCVSCHGPEKVKGNLRLDSYKFLLGGGGLVAGLVPGKPSESQILEHLRLPIESEEHMPPEGKPQPSGEEIDLLEWWIAAGAPEKTKLAALNMPEKVVRSLAGSTH